MIKKLAICIFALVWIATTNSNAAFCAEDPDSSSDNASSKALSPSEELEQADNLLDERDVDAAITVYEKLKDKFAPDKEKAKLRRVYRKLGIAYTLNKSYALAIASFNKALTLADRDKPEDVHSIVSIDYSLARAYQNLGQLDQALASCQSALELAKTKMADSHYVIRRLIALRAELNISSVAKKLDVQEESNAPEKVEDLSVKPAQASQSPQPLVGGVSSSEYFKAPRLMSEVPSLDGALKQAQQLNAKATRNSNKTTLYSGTKKVKNKMVQKLMEYGTMGLGLKKDLKAWPWYVRYVLTGGAASRYGLKRGDILNTIDGHPIRSLPIARIYHMLCGRRGEFRTLGITRGGKDMYFRIRLISVYEIGYRPTEYIEYYWFLLYNGYITNAQYARLAAPWNRYFK